MKIKNYIQFIKESSGCVMVEIPVSNWNEITSYIDEGFFDFFKKKEPKVYEPISMDQIRDCVYDITDEDRIKNSINDENLTGNFVDNKLIFGVDMYLYSTIKGFDVYIRSNNRKATDIATFRFSYDPNEISDDEVGEILNRCKSNLESFDCKVTYFIGWKSKSYASENGKSNTEWSDFERMLKKITILPISLYYDKDKIRCISVKIETFGGIEESINISQYYDNYKINESSKHGDLEYDSEWKLPTSPIRKELESYLRNFLLEIEDLGYRPQIKGFIRSDFSSKPYVWIKNQRGLTHDEFWNEIDPIVETIKSYLESEGFSIHIKIIEMKYEEVFIYFDKIEDGLNENKMWYKTIPEILEWIESKSTLPFIWCDTETTGLGGPKQQQLTQVSAIATQYDFKSNNFSEIATFDEKIKLTDETKSKFLKPEDKTKWVLSFNHYGSGDYKYKNEKDIVEDFFRWISNYSPNVLVAQNASFDMAMLSGRYGHKINSEVFDTKMLIQLYFLPLLQTLAETDSKYKEMIDFIGTSQRDNGLISSSMSKIGPVLGINMMGYHDAITDCRITIQMYQKIIELLKQNQDVDIMKYQVERIKTLR